jgi:hypothetical protein
LIAPIVGLQDAVRGWLPQRTAFRYCPALPSAGLGGALQTNAALSFVDHAKQEIAMRNEKWHAATIRLKPDLWRNLERLAQEDRRPVGQYLRIVIAGHVKANTEQKSQVAA